MERTNILVTAACGDVGYSTIRALSKEGLYNIVGTDIQTLCPVADLLDKFHTVPRAEHKDYPSVMLELCRQHGISLLLPISENEIATLNRLRNLFADSGVTLLMQSQEVLSVFMDKLNTARYFESLGYRVPKTITLSDYDDSFAFPLICKPRSGYGSTSVRTLNSFKELEAIQAHGRSDLLLQEYIGTPDEEYTTGVFSNGQQCDVITFRRYLGISGFSQVVYAMEEAFMAAMAADVAKDLNIQGSFNIQTRKVDGVHVPFEVNPRISSTVMFRSRLGFSDAHWWAQAALGNGYTYNSLKPGAVGIRYLTEAVFPADVVPKSLA